MSGEKRKPVRGQACTVYTGETRTNTRVFTYIGERVEKVGEGKEKVERRYHLFLSPAKGEGREAQVVIGLMMENPRVDSQGRLYGKATSNVATREKDSEGVDKLLDMIDGAQLLGEGQKGEREK